MPTARRILRTQHVRFGQIVDLTGAATGPSFAPRDAARRSPEWTHAFRLVAGAHDRGTTIRLIGRMQAEHVEHLRAEIAASPPPTTLDLNELGLADVEGVRFLVTLEREGVVLRHCAPFIREWMAREAN